MKSIIISVRLYSFGQSGIGEFHVVVAEGQNRKCVVFVRIVELTATGDRVLSAVRLILIVKTV